MHETAGRRARLRTTKGTQCPSEARSSPQGRRSPSWAACAQQPPSPQAPAGAATPSCGPSCIDPFSFQFGTHHSPNYVLDVFRQGDKVGQPIILFRASNDDPAEDFTVSFQGTVSDFYAAGLVSARRWNCTTAAASPAIAARR